MHLPGVVADHHTQFRSFLRELVEDGAGRSSRSKTQVVFAGPGPGATGCNKKRRLSVDTQCCGRRLLRQDMSWLIRKAEPVPACAGCKISRVQRRGRNQNPRNYAGSDFFTALSVSSISASVCAVDTNQASNCDGGKYTPLSIMPWKKAPNDSRSVAEALPMSITGFSVKNTVNSPHARLTTARIPAARNIVAKS